MRKQPPPRRARRVLPFLALACLALPAAGAAQSGRWWWDGSIDIIQQQNRNRQGTTELGRVEQQDLRIALGLNGYLGQPWLGSFRLGLELLTSELRGSRELDTDRLGFDLDLDLIPRSDYPTRVFFRRSRSDYAFGSSDPFSLLGAPESTRQWGGRVRLRRGFLQGTEIGFEHTGIDVFEAEKGEEIQGRQFLDWSDSSDRSQRSLHAERSRHRFATVDLDLEDRILNISQRTTLTPAWRWELSGDSLWRDIAVGGARPQTTSDLLLRNRWVRSAANGRELDIRYNTGLNAAEFGDSIVSHALSVFYRWQPGSSWELGPFAFVSLQRADAVSVSSPRLGLEARWKGSRHGFDSRFSARLSYGLARRRTAEAASNETQAAFALSAALAHGEADRLRQELEIEGGRNELRLGRDLLLDLPDLDLARTGLSTEDFYRARLTLTRRRGVHSLTGWSEWSRRRSASGLALRDFDSRAVRGLLQYSQQNLTLQGEAGTSDTSRPLAGDQQVRFLVATARWRLSTALDLRAAYRSDRRRLVLSPDVDGRQLEIEIDWRFGAFTVQALGWERRQTLLGTAPTTNRGFRWTVSRRFSGWLPIVTGSSRRGIVR